jgi:hypothetical protein
LPKPRWLKKYFLNAQPYSGITHSIYPDYCDWILERKYNDHYSIEFSKKYSRCAFVPQVVRPEPFLDVVCSTTNVQLVSTMYKLGIKLKANYLVSRYGRYKTGLVLEAATALDAMDMILCLGTLLDPEIHLKTLPMLAGHVDEHRIKDLALNALKFAKVPRIEVATNLVKYHPHVFFQVSSVYKYVMSGKAKLPSIQSWMRCQILGALLTVGSPWNTLDTTLMIRIVKKICC